MKSINAMDILLAADGRQPKPTTVEKEQEWRWLWQGRRGALRQFPSAFRQSRRDGKPRGIVKIGGTP